MMCPTAASPVVMLAKNDKISITQLQKEAKF